MSQVEKNRQSIQRNRKRIFKIDLEVMFNQSFVDQTRAKIEENRFMILSNYAAAFMGNRHLANHNSDEIFKNRQAILTNAEPEGEVQENYVQAQINRASLDYLSHKSDINSAALEISEKMADINTLLIDVNQKIMAVNDDIVRFNSEQINVNKELIAGSLRPAEATAGDNAVLISENHDSMNKLEKNIEINRERMQKLMEVSKANSRRISKDKQEISERRLLIHKNKENIEENRSAIIGQTQS